MPNGDFYLKGTLSLLGGRLHRILRRAPWFGQLKSFGGWAAALAFFLLLLEAAAEAEDVDLAIAAYGRIQNFMMIDKRMIDQ